MKKQKLLIVILILFLLGDTVYSFLQYYHIPLDGDIAGGVVPSPDVQQILNDPFGFHLLSSGEKHVNPNRFFSHYFFKGYMENVPLWLQSITDPITSVYLACALLKIFIHLLVLFILAALISGTKKLWDKNFLLSAALIVPFIQANGYWGHMGINDKATTYCFFYALPVVLMMLFLMPFYRIVFKEEKVHFGPLKSIILILMAVVLPLTGPLNPAIALIVSALTGIHYLLKYSKTSGSHNSLLSSLSKIPGQIYLFLGLICLFSLYSLFLGKYDSNYTSETIPVAERYLKLPLGIYYQISQSLGVPLLLIIIGINVYLIQKKFASTEGMKIINTLKWIGIFAAIYLLLLPLGGYRPYRPNILRYDTFMPITIALLYFYGHSTYFLIKNMELSTRKIYSIGLLAIFAIFMNSDKLKTKEYACERKALEYLAGSPDEVTLLPTQCNVMSWEPFSDPMLSENNAILLKRWNITKEKKLYYHSTDKKE
ncbi:MAG TPA: hypothetical protein VFG54_03060 [Prolixibacteraceae bacterium]|nr:hypothetical protein [Prolixibacteraceae bacterium]